MSNALQAAVGQFAKIETNENEALVALRQATRMLKTAGVDWTDVALVVSAYASSRSPDLHQDGPADLADIMRQMNEAMAKPRRQYIDGEDIPDEIVGTVELTPPSSIPGVRRTLDITDPVFNITYSGITVCQPRHLDILAEAQSIGKKVRISITHPGHAPDETLLVDAALVA